MGLTVARLWPLSRSHEMPEFEPSGSATLVIVTVPTAFQKDDPSFRSVRFSQIKSSLRSIVTGDRSIAQVYSFQSPLFLEAVFFQDLD